ncbi:hypothetical protein [Campylobacter estrildidarum]|uniref:hypothetical protein n=1 Tax=Campylobacter estrildidarum TaxID=2510189 RepID=UPI0026A7BB8F
MFLSKSRYIRALQCVKSLWLKTYKSEVLDTPNENVLAKFSTGDKVGELAYSLFSKGVKIEFESSTFEEKCQLTKDLINQDQEIIYEATFFIEAL